MPKVFFSTPAVSVLKILTGPSDKPDYSVPDFVYVLLLNVKYFVSCVYAFIYGKLYVVVPLHAMVPPPPRFSDIPAALTLMVTSQQCIAR